ncbi:hypothetical protein MFLO_13313 [Listeria floridensis FSL S10-1187]|uniref:Uncharacterized protein n=1 Tax=Listeria floridensis FSL S10-1187 TaxID=1265817 RepID=A0ABP3AWC6_9LIST|nr:hypothetical protein [Listeria floridensis]EUJ27442.1 hypothetical protein MFLO_13313 [Listeria floridensis FSL S10-1187]
MKKDFFAERGDFPFYNGKPEWLSPAKWLFISIMIGGSFFSAYHLYELGSYFSALFSDVYWTDCNAVIYFCWTWFYNETKSYPAF